MPRHLPDDPKPWKVLTSEYLSREFWHTVRLEKVELPTGAVIAEYWVHEYVPWVNVVAVTTDDRILLVRQYRHGLGQVHFELPAGTTDPGEVSLEDAAKRELLEETGYGGGTWSLLTTLSANPALQNNLTHTFLAEGVVPMADVHLDAGEDLRLHVVPFAELEALLDVEDELIQALHVAPLMKYVLRRTRAAVAAKGTR
ncbi:MAG: hydrolase [Myxococcales bacterium]|nr:hydrolase [Myxococcales bacterium]